MTTFLDALRARVVAASEYAKDDKAAPAALLWPDKEREWAPLIPLLRAQLPVLTLGEYAPEQLTGPSYWIRCVVDGAIEGIVPEGVIPVVYLPGVSKEDIRAADETPQLRRPLAELQYRGAPFNQKNGKDWTIPAFLQSEDGGLGIPTAADAATKAAILGARSILATLSVEEMLAKAPLKASFFNDKLKPDLSKNVLAWLSDPAGYEADCTQEEWEAFRAQCRSDYRQDPNDDGPVTMARELGLGQSDAWELAWQRFAEAPEKYPGIPERLRAARPRTRKQETTGLWDKPGRWPQENEEAEKALREALQALAEQPPAEARAKLLELEASNAARRSWVWAGLGQASLAGALAFLAELANRTAIGPKGNTALEIADWYANEGWKTDDLVLRSRAAVERQG